MDDQPLIDFRTSEDWLASDLASVLDSLDQMYNVIALARHLGLMEKENLARSLSDAEENWFRFQKMGPELDMLLHEWTRYLRRAGPEAVRFFPGLLPNVQTSQVSSISNIDQEYGFYLKDPSTFLSQINRLSIKRIKMASPGGFSLKGMGEPIKQLRELIKDLCYRNQQERQMGELELLKKKLGIASEHNLSPQQIHVLATKSIEHQQYIGDVIGDGRLTLEGNMPESPNEKSQQRRIRTRKKPQS